MMLNRLSRSTELFGVCGQRQRGIHLQFTQAEQKLDEELVERLDRGGDQPQKAHRFRASFGRLSSAA